VKIIGAHVPVSGWTLVALAVGSTASLLWWQVVGQRARWRRWRPGATLCALLSFTLVVALTLTPDGSQPTLGLSACIPYDWNDFVYNIFHTGGGSGGEVLNLIVMVPLTFSVVLASRRVLPAVALGVLLPTGIEFLQTLLPGRDCAITDMLTNSLGGLLGAAAGWAVEVRSRRGTARPERQSVGP
jgi:glycopeptide antibiotics resistance protein